MIIPDFAGHCPTCWRLKQANNLGRDSCGEHAVKARHQHGKSGRSGRREERSNGSSRDSTIAAASCSHPSYIHQLRTQTNTRYTSTENKVPATPSVQSTTKNCPSGNPKQQKSHQHKAQSTRSPTPKPAPHESLLAFAALPSLPWLTERTYFAWRYLSFPCAPQALLCLPTPIFSISPPPCPSHYASLKLLILPTYHHSCRHSLGITICVLRLILSFTKHHHDV